MKEAGVRLKQLRRKKEITQEQVAAELNISVDTLRKNEQGIRGMSVELLDIYADYYNVDITSMKEVPEQLRKPPYITAHLLSPPYPFLSPVHGIVPDRHQKCPG